MSRGRLSRRVALAAVPALLVPMLARGQSAPIWERFEPARRLLDGAVPTSRGITLDLPLVSEDGTSVPLTVAVTSPMTKADHVTEIHLLATRNPSPEIARLTLTPGLGRAEIGTRIRLDGTQSVVAIARTSRGALLAAAREVTVTTSGCLVPGNAATAPDELATRVRVSSPAGPGRAVEVLTLVNHPMETGLRPGPSGAIPPQRIIKGFRAEIAGRTVFEAELHRSLSANPYLKFFLAPAGPGEARFVWTEDTGRTVEARAAIGIA